jgi:hypothetical protein
MRMVVINLVFVLMSLEWIIFEKYIDERDIRGLNL